MNIWQRIKRLWQLPEEMGVVKHRVRELHERIGRHTEVHAEVSPKTNIHRVIVIGRYDYVNLFHVRTTVFAELVEHLEPYAHVGRSMVWRFIPSDYRTKQIVKEKHSRNE